MVLQEQKGLAKFCSFWCDHNNKDFNSNNNTESIIFTEIKFTLALISHQKIDVFKKI